MSNFFHFFTFFYFLGLVVMQCSCSKLRIFLLLCMNLMLDIFVNAIKVFPALLVVQDNMIQILILFPVNYFLFDIFNRVNILNILRQFIYLVSLYFIITVFSFVKILSDVCQVILSIFVVFPGVIDLVSFFILHLIVIISHNFIWFSFVG